MKRRRSPAAGLIIAGLIGAGLAVGLGPQVARGYSLKKDGAGRALLWPKRNIEILVDTSGITKATSSQVISAPMIAAAVSAAFKTWTSSGVPLEVQTSIAKTTLHSGNDDKNVVRWETANWMYVDKVVAMTLTIYKQSSALIKESDIVLNAHHQRWSTKPAPGSGDYDVQNVLTHEVGHLMGLGHSADPSATMYLYTPAEELDKRTLGPDDLAAVAALVQAGVAAGRGDLAAARQILVQAAEGFDSVRMDHYAAAARWRLAQLTEGPEGRKVLAQIDAQMRQQAVRDSARWTAMLASGPYEQQPRPTTA